MVLVDEADGLVTKLIDWVSCFLSLFIPENSLSPVLSSYFLNRIQSFAAYGNSHMVKH